jgi:hypothetical protein
MKKENIQSRNRKLSAKSRKKHNSFSADMLKPFEKMYGYGMGSAMAGSMSSMSASGMGSSGPYYMTPHQSSPTSNAMHYGGAAAAAASMHQHMTNPFGTSSFGGMVRDLQVLNFAPHFFRLLCNVSV